MRTALVLLTLAFLALVLLAAPAMADSKLSPEARHALRDAQLHLDKKEYGQAARHIEQYIATATEKIPEQAYLMLGGAHHLNGDMKQAAKWFIKGNKAYPANENLVLNAAVACYELERYKEAGKYFEKTYATRKPVNPAHLFQAGSAYYAGESYKDSARVMIKLLNTHKEQNKDWTKLAIHALIGAKQYAKAEKMVLRYLAITPSEAPYWELLAKLHLDRNNYREAAGALEICYRLRKPTQKELERLAAIYNYEEAPLMAAATLKRAYASPSPDQTGKIALLKASAGRTDSAVKTIAAGKTTTPLIEKKGLILYQARRFDEAEAAFRQVLKRDAKAGESRYHLALCQWEKRQWEEASNEFAKLSKIKKYRRLASGPLLILKDLETARQDAQ